MSDVHHVLWTGGWDSTFRVASLVRAGHTVQPLYVVFEARGSTRKELDTIDRLTRWLAAWKPESEHLLRPTEVIGQEEATSQPWTLEAWERLSQRHPLGRQCTALSSAVRARGLTDVEIGVHRDDNARALLVDDVVRGPDGLHRLVAEPSHDDLRIFAPFAFPLFDLTKLEMGSIAQEQGFAPALEMTWFCHRPAGRGVPCGRCNPCRYTREEGLGRRIPPELLSVRARRFLRRSRKRVRRRSAALWRGRPPRRSR